MFLDVSIDLLIRGHARFPPEWCVARATNQPDGRWLVRFEISGPGLPDELVVPTLYQTVGTIVWKHGDAVLGTVTYGPEGIR